MDNGRAFLWTFTPNSEYRPLRLLSQLHAGSKFAAALQVSGGLTA
jgi:DNA gyrase/topoisomerase IV subunit B